MTFRRIRFSPRFLTYIFSIVLIGTYVTSTIPVPQAHAATSTTVGQVESKQGKVWGEAKWSSNYAKVKGDLVAQDEVIATGYKSSTTIKFIDSTIMKLGANAKITIDEMVYDPGNDENDKVVFRLGAGAFYFVSGKVAKQKVTLITPTATIGIRGTELVINVKDNGETSVGVTKGRAYMRSRQNNSSSEIGLGNTAHSDDQGNVGEARKGVDLTGDDDVDSNIEGVSDWQGEDDKKDDNIGEFSDDGHDDHGKTDDGEGDREGKDNDGHDNEGHDNEGDGKDDGESSDGENDGEDSSDNESENDGEGSDGDGDGDGGDSDGGDSDGGGDGDGGDSDGGGDGDSDGGSRSGHDGGDGNDGHD